MRTIVMVLILTAAYTIRADVTVSDKLIDRLIILESKGKNIVGDQGRAFGKLQIWEVVVQDVNRIYRKHYKHSDAFNTKKAREICRLYLVHYGKVYERQTGRKAGDVILARIWNGGPDGYKDEATIAYVQKLRKIN